MTHRRWITTALILATLLVGGRAVPAFAADPGLTNDTIKIGFFGPRTGRVYMYGELAMNGAELVYQQVNAKGGIHGRKIVTVREDDECKNEGGIAAVKKLIYQQQVFMIHGGGCSNPTIAAKEEVDSAKVPMVVLDAVADSISEGSAVIYQPGLTANLESVSQVDFAKAQGAKKLAVVWQNDAWGKARYVPLMEKLKKEGVTPVADEEMTGEQNDATAVVLKVQKSGADAMLVLLYPKPAAVFIRDALKFGYKPLYVGTTATADLVDLQKQVAVPGALDRFFAISQVKVSLDDPDMESWRQALTKQFPNDRLSIFHMFGIAGAKVVVAALEKAGPNLTRTKLVETLNAMCGLDTGIYPGPVCFKPDDHRGSKSVAWIFLTKDGKIDFARGK
jgi:branched-chain amino acid transport system substrate-binding protein